MPDRERGWDGSMTPDLCRGQYLCEVCEEAMTDDVLLATESPTGVDLAICARCRRLGRTS